MNIQADYDLKGKTLQNMPHFVCIVFALGLAGGVTQKDVTLVRQQQIGFT